MRERTAFIIASTDPGTMIVNRFDEHIFHENQDKPDETPVHRIFGVGWEILHGGAHAKKEVSLCIEFLKLRRKYFGDGVVAVDAGANLGCHTLSMARAMSGAPDTDDWGSVIAIEAQK